MQCGMYILKNNFTITDIVEILTDEFELFQYLDYWHCI